MRIAFDVDGVLNEIIEFQIKYGRKFFKKKYNKDIVNENAYDIHNMFKCTKKQEKEFWTKHIFKLCFGIKAVPDAKKILKQMKSEGHYIFIVTKRAHTDEDSKLGGFMRTALKIWFKKNGLPYDKIIFCQKDELKSDIVDRNRIDIMFEDSSENAKDIIKFVPVILINTGYNKHVKGKQIYRVDTLEEGYQKIQEIEESKKEMASPLSNTGYNSIDRPSLKFFTKYDVEQKRKKCPYSLYEMLERRNRDFPKSKAITYGGKTISYGEFFKRIENVAQRFLKLGVKKGEIVTVCMPNTPEGIITVYALNKIGAVSHMIHPKSAPEEIKRYANECKSRIFLTLDSNVEDIMKVIDETCLETIIFVSPVEFYPMGILKTLYKLTNKVKIPEDKRFVLWKNTDVKEKDYIKYTRTYNAVTDDAVIMRTSGSEGYDKAIYLASQALNENVIGFVHGFKDFQRGEFCPSIMPIFHGFGLCSSVHLPLLCGLVIEPIPRPNMKNILSCIKRDANYIIGVPTILSGLVNDKKTVQYVEKKGHKIKLFVCGGDAPGTKITKRFKKLYNIEVSQGYGSTETTAGVTFTQEAYSIKTSEVMMNKLAENSELLNENSILYTCGIPSYDTNVKIVSNRSGKELKAYHVGEIYITGPSVMLRIKDKETTKQVLYKHEDGNLWYKTGDYGFVDPDGRLYFVDRVSNTFKKNGYNIYPSKITKIAETFDCIDKSAVVPIPDEIANKRIGLLIILKAGYEFNEELKNELMEAFSEHLPIYHLPDVISETKEFKLTKKGSINYKALKDQYEGTGFINEAINN